MLQLNWLSYCSAAHPLAHTASAGSEMVLTVLQYVSGKAAAVAKQCKDMYLEQLASLCDSLGSRAFHLQRLLAHYCCNIE